MSTKINKKRRAIARLRNDRYIYIDLIILLRENIRIDILQIDYLTVSIIQLKYFISELVIIVSIITETYLKIKRD